MVVGGGWILLDCVHGCEQTLVRNLGEREIAYEIGKKKKKERRKARNKI